jgi:hypothetical protein
MKPKRLSIAKSAISPYMNNGIVKGRARGLKKSPPKKIKVPIMANIK